MKEHSNTGEGKLKRMERGDQHERDVNRLSRRPLEVMHSAGEVEPVIEPACL
jgi:hypothetical protein